MFGKLRMASNPLLRVEARSPMFEPRPSNACVMFVPNFRPKSPHCRNNPKKRIIAKSDAFARRVPPGSDIAIKNPPITMAVIPFFYGTHLLAEFYPGCKSGTFSHHDGS